MGGKHVPEDSLQQTRARIGLIAEELSRRTTREALEADGRRLYEETKAKAMVKADELKERAKEAAREKAEELKAQAKDQIRLKADQWKEQAMASPTTYAVVGALTGAAAGAAVGKFQSRGRHSAEFRTLEIEGGVIGERDRLPLREGVDELRSQAAGKLDDVKEQVGEKVDDLKERASSAVENARERVSSAVEEVKERASHLREHVPSLGEVRERSVRRGRDLLRDQPILVACGAIALGALAAWLVPVTESERRLIEPVQSRAREGMRKVGEVVQEKISDVTEQVNEKIDQLGESQQASAEGEHEDEAPYRAEGEPPAIH